MILEWNQVILFQQTEIENFWLKEFKDKFSLPAYISCILLGCNRKFIEQGNFKLTIRWFLQEKEIVFYPLKLKKKSGYFSKVCRSIHTPVQSYIYFLIFFSNIYDSNACFLKGEITTNLKKTEYIKYPGSSVSIIRHIKFALESNNLEFILTLMIY